MSFDKHVSYSASCDVRTDKAGAGVPQTNAMWDAWEAADRPMEGPIYEALGKRCGASTGDIYAGTAAAARKELAAKGWTFKIWFRYAGVNSWRAACPEHKGLL